MPLWKAVRVRRPSQRAGSGPKALLIGRNGSGDHTVGPARVRSTSRGLERPSWWAGMGWEVLPEGQEGSEGHPGRTGGVRRPSSRAGWVGRACRKVGGYSRGPGSIRRPPEGPREVGRPCQLTGNSQETLPEGWQWSESPTVCLEQFRRPYQRTSRDCKVLLEGWEGL